MEAQIEIRCSFCNDILIKSDISNFDKILKELTRVGGVYRIFATEFVDNLNLSGIVDVLNNPKDYTKEDLLMILDELLKNGKELFVCPKCFFKYFV